MTFPWLFAKFLFLMTFLDLDFFFIFYSFPWFSMTVGTLSHYVGLSDKNVIFNRQQ